MSTVAVEFDPFSDDYFNDPTEVYRRLRDEAPVYRNEHYGFYAYALRGPGAGLRLAGLLQRPRRRPVHAQAGPGDHPQLPHDHHDGPAEHDRFRKLVSRVFTLRAVTALEPMVREVIVTHLDRLDGRDDFDVVTDFSAPFPVEIIARMLGVPPSGASRCASGSTSACTARRARWSPPRSREASLASAMYFYELSVAKRQNPADDMLAPDPGHRRPR